MDSLMGLELAYRIRNSVGVELPADTLFYQATIAQLADALLERLSGGTGAAAAPAERVLSPLTSSKSLEKPATAWLHGARLGPTRSCDCSVSITSAAPHRCSPARSGTYQAEISLCPVQLPGQRRTRRRTSAIRDFTTLIETLLDVLLEYLGSAVRLLGHSAGNLISYELAQLVRQRLGLSPHRTCSWGPSGRRT